MCQTNGDSFHNPEARPFKLGDRLLGARLMPGNDRVDLWQRQRAPSDGENAE